MMCRCLLGEGLHQKDQFENNHCRRHPGDLAQVATDAFKSAQGIIHGLNLLQLEWRCNPKAAMGVTRLFLDTVSTGEIRCLPGIKQLGHVNFQRVCNLDQSLD